jgi:hypothetical protein
MVSPLLCPTGANLFLGVSKVAHYADDRDLAQHELKATDVWVRCCIFFGFRLVEAADCGLPAKLPTPGRSCAIGS